MLAEGVVMPRTPIGKLLLDAGRINESQLRSALTHQERWRSRLGESLVALGYLPEQAVMEVLARQFDLPYVEIGDRDVPPAVLRLVPEALLRARHVFPLALLHGHAQEGPLLLAVTDPTDLATLDEVAFASGVGVKPVLASRRDVDRALDRHFEGLKDRLPRALDLPDDPGPMQIVARGHQRN